ncbi:unnamed protein product [Anisakis simplex]|uniref:Uncharacterized protein n=1 Tax=Anisakis simplex TaxID=6269 RepID=A0A0M3KG41_ANISI|nr:unnamed protein product [Anisakis simplex]
MDMDSPSVNNGNDADDSDSSNDLGYAPQQVPKRSATLSPAARSRFRHHSKSRLELKIHITPMCIPINPVICDALTSKTDGT